VSGPETNGSGPGFGCDDFAERLTAFNLGELDAGEAAKARAHVAGCGDCAGLVLADRALSSRLRAEAGHAPESVRLSVREALTGAGFSPSAAPASATSASATPATAPSAPASSLPKPSDPVVPAPVPLRPRRSRAWRLVSALAAAAVLLVAILVWTRPDDGAAPVSQAGTIGAAMQAFASGPLRFDPALGTRPGGSKQLTGLRVAGSGRMELAGTRVEATEYRGADGTRLAVFWWPGSLPPAYAREGGAPGPRTSTSGGTTSTWWAHNGVAWCVVGNIDRATYDRALDEIRHA
jgi:hypothetical protein